MSPLTSAGGDIFARSCRSAHVPGATCKGTNVAPHMDPERHGRPGMSLRTRTRSDTVAFPCRSAHVCQAASSLCHVALPNRMERHARARMSPLMRIRSDMTTLECRFACARSATSVPLWCRSTSRARRHSRSGMQVRPVRMPWPLALERARGSQDQVVSLEWTDDLHADRQARSRDPGSHRGRGLPRHVERDRERGNARHELRAALGLRGERAPRRRRIVRHGRRDEEVAFPEPLRGPGDQFTSSARHLSPPCGRDALRRSQPLEEAPREIRRALLHE